MHRDLPAQNGLLPFRPTPSRRRATVIPQRVPTVWCNRGRYVCAGQLRGHGDLHGSVVARTGPVPVIPRTWALIIWSRQCQENPRLPPEFRYYPSRTEALAAAHALDCGQVWSCVDADPAPQPRIDGRLLDNLIKARREAAGAYISAPRSCGEPGCERPHHADGLCGLHYMARRRGSITVT